MIPVALDDGVIDRVGLNQQVIRWDHWKGTENSRQRRLVRDLNYEFNRLLRDHLAQLKDEFDAKESLRRYLAPFELFLSHSKHDNHGNSIANAIRDWLHSHSKLQGFLDTYDIPPGVLFENVINIKIQNGFLAAIYTDSYSSREWCRREVISAKRMNVPMMVVDCLHSRDERCFPYLGNVPTVRMNPDRIDRIGNVVDCILDEIFKDLFWQCCVEEYRQESPHTLFMARPPELLTLAASCLPSGSDLRTIVHPGPALGFEEKQLFADVAPSVQVYNLVEWLAPRRT